MLKDKQKTLRMEHLFT